MNESLLASLNSEKRSSYLGRMTFSINVGIPKANVADKAAITSNNVMFCQFINFIK